MTATKVSRFPLQIYSPCFPSHDSTHHAFPVTTQLFIIYQSRLNSPCFPSHDATLHAFPVTTQLFMLSQPRLNSPRCPCHDSIFHAFSVVVNSRFHGTCKYCFICFVLKMNTLLICRRILLKQPTLNHS